jgi:predicted phosphodiesterase
MRRAHAVNKYIHGNSVALDATLSDIAAEGGADAYWVLGDLVALGPDPVRVLERLTALPNARFIRGNTDRYVTFGDRPGPTLEEVNADPRLASSLAEVANTFAWTQGMITASGWLDWLRDLPLEMDATLPDGSQFLGVHASPGRDDGTGVIAGMDDGAMARLFEHCTAQLVCVGHTHQPANQRYRDIHVVNLGAVSLSLTADRWSSYVLLDASKECYTVSHRRVAYDRSAVIEHLNRLHHPGRAYLIKHLSDDG